MIKQEAVRTRDEVMEVLGQEVARLEEAHTKLNEVGSHEEGLHRTFLIAISSAYILTGWFAPSVVPESRSGPQVLTAKQEELKHDVDIHTKLIALNEEKIKEVAQTLRQETSEVRRQDTMLDPHN
jgi:hypothetical protein